MLWHNEPEDSVVQCGWLLCQCVINIRWHVNFGHDSDSKFSTNLYLKQTLLNGVECTIPHSLSIPTLHYFHDLDTSLQHKTRRLLPIPWECVHGGADAAEWRGCASGDFPAAGHSSPLSQALLNSLWFPPHHFPSLSFFRCRPPLSPFLPLFLLLFLLPVF